MNRKTKITSVLLALTITLTGLFIAPITAQAAGWLDAEVKNLTLGTAVSGSMKPGDYRSLSEGDWRYPDGREVYWHVYKFSMPQDGILNIYMESASKEYFTYPTWQSYGYFNGLVIFSTQNPDALVWRSMNSENELQPDYSASRSMYYSSTEVVLNQGSYYFVVRQYDVIDTPYYLTLSYKEPDVNVTSISLDKKNVKLEPGEQDTLSATVFPYNATNKTVVWESSDTSVASVENGIITAVSPGRSTITASSSDGEITASCVVAVIDTAAIDELEESQPEITSLTAARRKATVHFSSIGISDVKYQVAYKTGGGAWKIKNTASTSITIRSLKSKKTYSVRVRGYKSIDGTVYYSSWSKAKRVKVK